MIQEEIREELERYVGDGVSQDLPSGLIVSELLIYLHSKGVVIKVEGELPAYGHVGVTSTGVPNTSTIKTHIPSWIEEWMGNNNIVAVEPLIK